MASHRGSRCASRGTEAALGQLTNEAAALNTLASIMWDQDEPAEAVEAVFRQVAERQRALGLRRSLGGRC